jgi:heme/copper-type cytochrome/quinol oxidase subunit 2
MQNAIFWTTAGTFLVAQLGTLLYLIVTRHREVPGSSGAQARSVEIVWTLVPAALLVVLVLMMGGWLEAGWSQRRDVASTDRSSSAPITPQTVADSRWAR